MVAIISICLVCLLALTNRRRRSYDNRFYPAQYPTHYPNQQRYVVSEWERTPYPQTPYPNNTRPQNETVQALFATLLFVALLFALLVFWG